MTSVIARNVSCQASALGFPRDASLISRSEDTTAALSDIPGNGREIGWKQRGRIQEFFLSGGGGGGPNITQYVETVLQLMTSTPSQFSVSHSIASASSTVFNRVKERGCRLRHRHIAESRCFCKHPVRLLCRVERYL